MKLNVYVAVYSENESQLLIFYYDSKHYIFSNDFTLFLKYNELRLLHEYNYEFFKMDFINYDSPMAQFSSIIIELQKDKTKKSIFLYFYDNAQLLLTLFGQSIKPSFCLSYPKFINQEYIFQRESITGKINLSLTINVINKNNQIQVVLNDIQAINDYSTLIQIYSLESEQSFLEQQENLILKGILKTKLLSLIHQKRCFTLNMTTKYLKLKTVPQFHLETCPFSAGKTSSTYLNFYMEQFFNNLGLLNDYKKILK